MYSFKVGNVDEIDLARVVREAQEDAIKEGKAVNVIVVASPKAKECLVLLSEVFLAQFNDADRVFIGGVRLMPDFGNWRARPFSALRPVQITRHTIEWTFDTAMLVPNGWRVLIVDNGERVYRQIARAIAYKRELMLTVETFYGKE